MGRGGGTRLNQLGLCTRASQRNARGGADVPPSWSRHAPATVAAAASHELINWRHGTSANDSKIIFKKCYYSRTRDGRLSNVCWCGLGRLSNPETCGIGFVDFMRSGNLIGFIYYIAPNFLKRFGLHSYSLVW